MAELWIFVALAFIVGALAGLGVAALQRRRNGNEEDIGALREEFEAYREDVTTHFVQTADLINNLTQSYKAVYDHLGRGAFDLVGEERLKEELEAVDAEPVMLEYLGKQGNPQRAKLERIRPDRRAPEPAPPGDESQDETPPADAEESPEPAADAPKD